MRRLLLLHGYTQNANIFYKRMSAIRKACEKDVEFIFVDAPHVVESADMAPHSLQWLQAAEANVAPSDPDDALTPRAWWRANEAKTIYFGLDKTMTFFSEWLRENKVNGILGFSQGGAMAAILAAVLERPELWPGFLVDGKPIHPPLDFFVPVSGFLPLDTSLATVFSESSPKLKTPSLHVLGDTDFIVVKERSEALISACDEATTRIERHEGGHFIPSKTNWRRFFKEYLTGFGKGVEITSPEPLLASNNDSMPSSQDTSRVGTPMHSL